MTSVSPVVYPVPAGHLPASSAIRTRQTVGARSGAFGDPQQQRGVPANTNPVSRVVGGADAESVLAARLAKGPDAARCVGSGPECTKPPASGGQPADLAVGYQFNSPEITTVVLGSGQNSPEDK